MRLIYFDIKVIATIFLIFTACLLSCKRDVNSKENYIKINIAGEWERHPEDHDPERYPTSLVPDNVQGMSILSDSIEIYEGIFRIDPYRGPDKIRKHYLGSKVPYTINNDSILFKNPLSNRWELLGIYSYRQKDTLVLRINDTNIVKYKKRHFNIEELADFDQIIFSSSGCYDACPILDISIDKSGLVYFQGECFVNQVGFFTTKIHKNVGLNIFNKFRQAKPLELLDEYNAPHTDDQYLITTFVKNGKIVKTVRDYGMEAPKDLLWAYIPISNIHNTCKLDSLHVDKVFKQIHYFLTFKKDGLILQLEKSESFFLWTELYKSKVINYHLNPKYKLTFIGKYELCNTEMEVMLEDDQEVKSITTDGQFYRLEFKDGKSKTFDLGYNFIERHFNNADFRKPNQWE